MSSIWSGLLKPNERQLDAERLVNFEHELGAPLPSEYRRFLTETNGGKVVVEHNLYVPDFCYETFVKFFLPLSAPIPFIGIIEARRLQVANRLCLRQAIEIADDMGTGFFYLIIGGTQAGAIYHCYKDDRCLLSQKEWDRKEVVIPDYMGFVSADFRRLLLEIRKRQTN